MSVRRRSDDRDWHGASNREPWDGPSSQWGEDVNTRIGQLEIGQEQLSKDLAENTKLTKELLRIFSSGKRGVVALATGAIFLGWSGVQQLWEWMRHLFAAAK